jgi:hypothetical protein
MQSVVSARAQLIYYFFFKSKYKASAEEEEEEKKTMGSHCSLLRGVRIYTVRPPLAARASHPSSPVT